MAGETADEHHSNGNNGYLLLRRTTGGVRTPHAQRKTRGALPDWLVPEEEGPTAERRFGARVRVELYSRMTLQ